MTLVFMSELFSCWLAYRRLLLPNTFRNDQFDSLTLPANWRLGALQWFHRAYFRIPRACHVACNEAPRNDIYTLFGPLTSMVDLLQGLKIYASRLINKIWRRVTFWHVYWPPRTSRDALQNYSWVRYLRHLLGEALLSLREVGDMGLVFKFWVTSIKILSKWWGLHLDVLFVDMRSYFTKI